MIGPRSRGSAAPQRIGQRAAPGSGCEVSRICDERLELVMRTRRPSTEKAPRGGREEPVECLTGPRVAQPIRRVKLKPEAPFRPMGRQDRPVGTTLLR
ncbi:hypothetical protein mvi_46450 [Methylobacterium indicum]|uniref:Uncharacterized protein n=1 Tax=Methylobacterium indicum TaxID=1775910 RepID=A0A8H8WXX1_9HYPH|nr:hypothetical protein mvi_46450 [Methylobacterium indicum]